jgi:sulfur relay (sulfurtransferase) DsrC/TusE family protein
MFKNDDIFGNLEKNLSSKTAARARVKQEYLSRAEQASDQIAKIIDNARLNGIAEFEISDEFKGPIVRYYRKYWIKYMQISLAIICLVMFISSFYTFQASYLFLLAFAVIMATSEDIYLLRLVGFGVYSSLELEKIKAKLFPRRYNFARNFFALLIVIIMSIIAHTISSRLLMPVELTNYLSFSGFEFKPDNEFFAFYNFILVGMMMFLRIFRKM